MKQDVLKTKIRERYGKIALSDNSDCRCVPSECCNTTDFNPKQSSIAIGYDDKVLESIPQSSILGLGSGTPLKFADLKKGQTVLDLGSGAGIDAFLASKIVKDTGKVIGIDFTDDMLTKATKAAVENGFSNVEFKKDDIEEKIPVQDSSVDVAISNCVINLTRDKLKTFKEIYRILRKDAKGKMVISDLTTSHEVDANAISSDNWCSCIDGLLTKEHYINIIRDARFQDIKILNEQLYKVVGKSDERKITSLVVQAVTGQ